MEVCTLVSTCFSCVNAVASVDDKSLPTGRSRLLSNKDACPSVESANGDTVDAIRLTSQIEIHQKQHRYRQQKYRYFLCHDSLLVQLAAWHVSPSYAGRIVHPSSKRAVFDSECFCDTLSLTDTLREFHCGQYGGRERLSPEALLRMLLLVQQDDIQNIGL